MEQQLLQPGESLGPEQPAQQPAQQQPQQAQPQPQQGQDQLLLHQGESLGDPVPAPQAQPEQPGFWQGVYQHSVGPLVNEGQQIVHSREDLWDSLYQDLEDGDIRSASLKAIKMLPFVDPKSPESKMVQEIGMLPVEEFRKARDAYRKGDIPAAVGHGAQVMVGEVPGEESIGAAINDFKHGNWKHALGDVTGGALTAGATAITGDKAAPEAEAAEAAPSLTDRAVSTAQNVASQVGDAVSDIGQTVARKAGQAAVNGAISFAGGVKDAVVGKISDALQSAIQQAKSGAGTPEEAVGSLRDLRTNVSSALKDTGLPPEVIQNVLDRVVDEYYVNTHSVAGGAPDSSLRVPPLEGDATPPPPEYKTLRDLGYTDSQINKMSPEERGVHAQRTEPLSLLERSQNFAREIVNEVEPPDWFKQQNPNATGAYWLKAKTFANAEAGATIGGIAGLPFGKGKVGAVGGAAAGALWGAAPPLAKATAKVLHDDYGLSMDQASAAVADFYKQKVANNVSSAVDQAVNKFNQARSAVGDAKDAVFAEPEGNTPLAKAANLPGAEDLKGVATRAQMTGGGNQAFEKVLRKNTTAARYIRQNIDAPAQQVASDVSQRIVDQITGQHLNTEDAGNLIQQQLGELVNNTHQTLEDVVNNSSVSKDLKMPGSEQFNSKSTSLGGMLDERGGIIEQVQNGTMDYREAQGHLTSLDNDIARTLDMADPATAARYRSLSDASVKSIDLANSQVYQRLMKANPDVVFDKLLQATPQDFQSIAGVLSENPAELQQGLAQRILEKSFDPSTNHQFRPDLLEEQLQGQKAKLGGSYDQLNTLSKGLKQLQKDWQMTEHAANESYFDSLSGHVFRAMGAMFGFESGGVMGALAGVAGGVAVDLTWGQVAKAIARFWMDPGALEDASAFSRAVSNIGQKVPAEAVNRAASKVQQRIRRAVRQTVKTSATTMRQAAESQ